MLDDPSNGDGEEQPVPNISTLGYKETEDVIPDAFFRSSH